jgi:hypothetical protein
MTNPQDKVDQAFGCAAAAAGKCLVVDCLYHDWLREAVVDADCNLPVGAGIPILASHVLLTAVAAAPRLVPIGTYAPTKRRRVGHTVAVARLLAFLRLADKFDKAPWANSHFKVNHGIFIRLAASHLPLIVGKEGARNERDTLLRLLSAHQHLDGSGNLIWITNRQQGKTTTIGKFIALLAASSVYGGLLATIYATGLDRAVELVKATKQYLHWYRGTVER